MNYRLGKMMLSAVLLASASAEAATVTMQDLASGAIVGQVELAENRYGVVFTPALTSLPAGLHGFHVHTNGSCDSSMKDGERVAGGGAGGHYDPLQTGRHGVPWQDDVHKGDLPPPLCRWGRQGAATRSGAATYVGRTERQGVDGSCRR